MVVQVSDGVNLLGRYHFGVPSQVFCKVEEIVVVKPVC